MTIIPTAAPRGDASRTAALRVDALANGYAQLLLDFPLQVPEARLQRYVLG